MLISRLWSRSRVSIIIAIGFGSAGFGQFIFGLYPSTGFNNESLSILTLWQSISLGVGLMLASPINGVLFSQLALLKGDIDNPDFSPLFQSLKRLCLVVSLILCAFLILITPSVFQGDFFLVLLLMASLLIQLIASAQRAVLAAQSAWWRFSAQFIIEGVGRSLVTFVVVSSASPSIKLLVLLNVAVQLCSVLFPAISHRWTPHIRLSPLPLRESARMFLPLWLAAVAVQSLLSLAPFLSRTLGKATPIQIAALGGLVQIVRIPVTFSSPITLPYLNRLATAIADNDKNSPQSILRFVCSLLGIIWGTYGLIVMGIGQFANLNAMAYAPLISQNLLWALLATSLSCPIALFLHSYHLLLQKPKVISTAWSIAILVYLCLMFGYGRTVVGSVLAIAAGATSAGLIFSASFFLPRRLSDPDENRILPV